uniref:Uncharacterized protein n=1 Tax=Anguilla anguilla TaxID=7936 RepID=A0A0E9URT1_ANGAN
MLEMIPFSSGIPATGFRTPTALGIYLSGACVYSAHIISSPKMMTMLGSYTVVMGVMETIILPKHTLSVY